MTETEASLLCRPATSVARAVMLFTPQLRSTVREYTPLLPVRTSTPSIVTFATPLPAAVSAAFTLTVTEESEVRELFVGDVIDAVGSFRSILNVLLAPGLVLRATSETEPELSVTALPSSVVPLDLVMVACVESASPEAVSEALNSWLTALVYQPFAPAVPVVVPSTMFGAVRSIMIGPNDAVLVFPALSVAVPTTDSVTPSLLTGVSFVQPPVALIPVWSSRQLKLTVTFWLVHAPAVYDSPFVVVALAPIVGSVSSILIWMLLFAALSGLPALSMLQ